MERKTEYHYDRKYCSFKTHALCFDINIVNKQSEKEREVTQATIVALLCRRQKRQTGSNTTNIEYKRAKEKVLL